MVNYFDISGDVETAKKHEAPVTHEGKVSKKYFFLHK